MGILNTQVMTVRGFSEIFQSEGAEEKVKRTQDQGKALKRSGYRGWRKPGESSVRTQATEVSPRHILICF